MRKQVNVYKLYRKQEAFRQAASAEVFSSQSVELNQYRQVITSLN